MTHQFKPGDRALRIPLQPGLPWVEVEVASHQYMSESWNVYTGDALPCGLGVDLTLTINDKPAFCYVRRLIPLPKNGPDAEVDMARKLVELHGGE